MDRVIENASECLQDLGGKLENCEKVCYLGYAENLVCFFEFAEHAQRAHAAPSKMCFAPPDHTVCYKIGTRQHRNCCMNKRPFRLPRQPRDDGW